ncbi:MAG: hypothetical protein AB4290_11015 [Spirulina sp.]
MERKQSPTLSSITSKTLPNETLKSAFQLLSNSPASSSPVRSSDRPKETHVPTKPKVKASETKPQRIWSTVYLAAQDVRGVLEQQRQQGHSLTTKLNILFVVNGALLTSLTLSRLMFTPSFFSLGEVIGFLVNFILLINAFLPRQVAISPNLEDKKFLERYLNLTPEEYQLKMIVNLVQTYQINKQRLDDISQSLTYSAYVTLAIAFAIMLHTVSAYFLPALETSFLGL